MSMDHLKKIEKWKVSTNDDCIALAEYICSCWDTDYGYAKIRKVPGENRRRLTLITGGWSENEYIVSAIEKNRTFSMICWQKSQRGGLHVYDFIHSEL